MRETLNPEEPHPMAYDALRYVRSQGLVKLMTIRAALASCAIEGNRMAEVCGETLRRVLAGEPVSDRYILGLAWYMREGIDEQGAGVSLLREARATLEMWKDVAPAVSLCADIDKFLEERKS